MSEGMSSLVRDVARYERWLHDRCDVVKDDLDFKHTRMREDAFVFLRATYFRWARTIEDVCPELAKAPRVLCIGDTHVENFGTWRDAEARHVWGVNDFDEAAVMPYPYDLVRLLTSARLSPHLRVAPKRAADAILEGYVEGLQTPSPVLLDEGAPWFRGVVRHLEDGASEFWVEVVKYPDADPPGKIQRALRHSLPSDAVVQRYATRRKGGGGLGRPRYLAIADWRGGLIVREAKAAVPSAWDWARARGRRSRFLDLAYGAFRSPDPSLMVSNGYLFRRVAPDSRKLDLKDVAKDGLSLTVLSAMGRDVGSIHAAHRRATLIASDLERRGGGSWLHDAAGRAQQAVEADYATWLADTDSKGRVRPRA
jgi:hypothetical protein